MIPVQKLHMFDQVYDHLLEQITSGALQPGERIKDAEWATRLNISRTPVREAMRKLAQEGLLTSLPTGGYEVRQLTRQELIDLYRCRGALEAAATREVALGASPALLQELEALIDEGDAAIERGDLDRTFELNTQFHALILGACANTFLKNMLGSLQRMVRFYRKSALGAARNNEQASAQYIERLRTKQRHHRSIHAALVARDAELAAKVMHDHVCATVEDLTDSLALHPLARVSRLP